MRRLIITGILLAGCGAGFSDESAARAHDRAQRNRAMDAVRIESSDTQPPAACTSLGAFDVRGWWSIDTLGPSQIDDREMREEAVRRGANWVGVYAEATSGNRTRATGTLYACPAESLVMARSTVTMPWTAASRRP